MAGAGFGCKDALTVRVPQCRAGGAAANVAERQAAGRAVSRRATVLGTVGVLLIAAVCIRLGFWQLDRLDQKRSRNAALAARMAEPPVSLTATLADSSGVIYRRAVADGVFDDARTIILPGRSYRGAPGVLVLTPLRLSGTTALLVQRGWMPSADGVSIDLEPLRVDSAVHVRGLVLPFLGDENTIAARARRDAPADTFRRVWYAIDTDALRAQFPYTLLPLRLQVLPDSARAAGDTIPVAQGAPALDEGPHLGYAIQWFSFALIFLVGWAALLRSRRGRAM